MKRVILIIAIALLAPSLAGGAETKKDSKGPQVINFEDDTIQGDLTKPDGEYVEAIKVDKVFYV
jgi:hypothetical protein